MNVLSVFLNDLWRSGRTKAARCEIMSSISTGKAALNKKKNIFNVKFGLNLSKG
jgi:hypothetical protein